MSSQRHPLTAIHVERLGGIKGRRWVYDCTVRRSRPEVKLAAQHLADSTGCRVRTARRDSTAFERIYFPTDYIAF